MHFKYIVPKEVVMSDILLFQMTYDDLAIQHLSKRGANMSMSLCGSPSLRASLRHDFIDDFISSMMVLAVSVDNI